MENNNITLSIVIICWNDEKVIAECLASIYRETHDLAIEVIVSDNGSTDRSVTYIRDHYRAVRIVENGANLGFAKGNNAGIRAAKGDYVLILNPDTIIHHRALETLVAFADDHAESGAFGCRVLNRDGSYQHPARPLPTLTGYLVKAFYIRWLARVSKRFESDIYFGWYGQTERTIGFQSGCCIMLRRTVLERLGGFDEQFFYHFEETDLCRRVWDAGSSIRFCPTAEVTHLGGQSVGRFPIRFALETYRSRYRYFFKHYGRSGMIHVRWISLIELSLRWVGYSLIRLVSPSDALDSRLKMYTVLTFWNWRVDPLRFIETGHEPDIEFLPIAAAPKIVG